MDNRCPKKLKDYPDAPCSEGKKAFDLARKNKTGGCIWFITDPEHCYCFFKLMKDSPVASTTARIAKLMMIDDNEVKRIIQNVRRNFSYLFTFDRWVRK